MPVFIALFGMRIVVKFNLAIGNYVYIECLYGVA